ncbi:hypothetical protein CLROS_028500 [Clostridium felsineum]|uniref:Uncharacterized protein n=1 Tax=Clostridium felsineum TaxID=36839 RepID=A0A1S8L355_9CLOT|nr:hypothetical protein CLROS_028500 [Clostridium felsineum]URZ12543.1 hypothetical protein CROST_032650 [Clostridium felsineum]
MQIKITKWFDALRKNDIKTASTYLNTSDKKISYSNKNERKIVEEILPKLKYKIISSTVSGDTAKISQSLQNTSK